MPFCPARWNRFRKSEKPERECEVLFFRFYFGSGTKKQNVAVIVSIGFREYHGTTQRIHCKLFWKADPNYLYAFRVVRNPAGIYL